MNIVESRFFSSFPLLSSAETEASLKTIFSLKPRWTEWKPGAFYTLGAGTYLFSQDLPAYFVHAKADNRLIWDNFQGILRLVVGTLERHFRSRVSFQLNLAMPGFHIFDFSGVQSFVGGGAHVDKQYLALAEFTNFRSDDASHVTVIVPLRVPLVGSGLDLWNLTSDDLQAKVGSNSSVDAVISGSPHTYVEYIPGNIVLFSSHLHHRMAPVDKCYPGDLRITLQAHCAQRPNGEWVLYW